MKQFLSIITLFMLVGCHNYEMDGINVSSEENNKLIVPPCLEK